MSHLCSRAFTRATYAFLKKATLLRPAPKDLTGLTWDHPSSPCLALFSWSPSFLAITPKDWGFLCSSVRACSAATATNSAIGFLDHTELRSQESSGKWNRKHGRDQTFVTAPCSVESGHYTITRSPPQSTLRIFPGVGFGGPHFPLSRAFPVAMPDECKKQ